MVEVSIGGSDDAYNLLPLCSNCHALYTRKHIHQDSIRAWKMLLLALNEAFDRRSIDLLLMLGLVTRDIFVSGDGLIHFAALLTSGYMQVGFQFTPPTMTYIVSLTEKGQLFIDAWKRGDQSILDQIDPLQDKSPG